MLSGHGYRKAGLGAVILVSVVCGPARAEDASQSGLALAREKYEELRNEIEDACLAERAEFPEKYQADLYSLGKRFQAEGDFDGVLAVRAEQQRYSSERTFPSSPSSSAPEPLRWLQQKYVVGVADADKSRSVKLHGLAKMYLGHLDELKKQYTRDGEIEMAAKIDAEAKRVQQSEEYWEHKLLTEESAESSLSSPENAEKPEESPDAAGDAGPLSEEAAELQKKLESIIIPSARNPQYYYYDADDTINEFVRYLWPHGIKLKMETVTSVVVRSVSNDGAGVPVYFAESSPQAHVVGAMGETARLARINALDFLERICAAYGCGYALEDGQVVLRDASAPGAHVALINATADEMAAEFKEDFGAASEKYGGKRVLITGSIDSLGKSLRGNTSATMAGGKVRVEFASDASTDRDLERLVSNYENSRSSVRSSSASGRVRRMGDPLEKPGVDGYVYSLTGAGECKVVGLTVYIKEAKFHGWRYVRR